MTDIRVMQYYVTDTRENDYTCQSDVCWGCILVECDQGTCHFLYAHSLEESLPRSTWLGDNQGVTATTQNGPK